jgi:hypothetical protein
MLSKIIALTAAVLLTCGAARGGQGQTHNPKCPADTIPYLTTRDSSGGLHDVACLDVSTGEISFPNLIITPGLGGVLSFADNSTQTGAAPAPVAAVDLANQTTAIPDTNVYLVPSTGFYRISCWVGKLGESSWTAGTVTLNINYTWLGLTNVSTPGSISYSYANGYNLNKVFYVQCDDLNYITYNVTFSGVTGTPEYDLSIRVEAM